MIAPSTTARSALDRLEQEGLITRQPGKGSIVLPPHVNQQLKTFAGFTRKTYFAATPTRAVNAETHHET